MINIKMEPGVIINVTDKPIFNNVGKIENYFYQGQKETTSACSDDKESEFEKQRNVVAQLIREQIQKEETSYKSILLPYYVAITLGMPKIWNRDIFNVSFSTQIPPDTWSRWLNGTDPRYQYKDDEIYPIQEKLEPYFR